jgi:hypothetical protein
MDEKSPRDGEDKDSRRNSLDAALNLSEKSPDLSYNRRESMDLSNSRKDSLNSLSLKIASSSPSSSKSPSSSSSSLLFKTSTSSSSLLKSSSSSSSLLKSPLSNHSKEPVPKIVQELLAAKQQREREEMLVAKQLKLDSIAARQHKMWKETVVKQRSSSSQGSEVSMDKDKDVDRESDKS